MMSLNNNKRKGRPANNSKIGRNKLYNDKAMTFDGVYGNSRLMRAAASLVGCVVEVQVRDGTTYEGILRTFSHQFDLVLETTHKVSPKGSPLHGVGPSLCNLLASFPFEEGGISDKLIFCLNDVVTLNAPNVDADYALKESFTDTAISKYNGQIMEKELEPWDGASSDSETPSLGVEEDSGANGWDANDMFRTNAEKYGVKSSYDTSMQEYTVVLTKKDTEDYKIKEAKASQIAHEIEMNMSYQTRMQLENGDEEDRFSAVVRTDEGVSKYVLPQKRRPAPGAPKRPPSAAAPKPYAPSVTAVSAKPFPSHLQAGPLPPPTKETGEISLNGGVPSEPPLETPPPPSKPYVLCHPSTQTLPPRIERRRENERKLSMQKGRNDEIEEFRKFSSNFKLTEESKESPDAREDFSSVENKSDSAILANKLSEQVKIEKDVEAKTTDISKSTLNPNAKEFVFNPNAKSFTPRSVPASSPQSRDVPPQPQRLQAQSPVIVVPHSQMIPGLPQPIFTAMAAPQYVMQAAPFTTSHQPPRFRKVPLSLQPRHEITPSMHVAAATGQPILAPAAMPTMQYASPQLHTAGPPQQTMGYPQMNFVVGPRVVSPQPVGVVPTSHSVSYCDASHLPAHLLNKYCIAVSAHPGNSLQQQQQHHHQQSSHHHPPQSQTPVLHPSPSPVHAQPPTAVMYPTPGSQQQHALQQQAISHHQAMTAAAHHHHAHHHHHHPGYPGAGPQPVVLMQSSQQGQHPPSHHPQLHMVQGGHHHHHVLPQMTLLPTSGPASTPPFGQHPQGV